MAVLVEDGGFDIHARHDDGMTTLMRAARLDLYGVCRYLIAKGALRPGPRSMGASGVDAETKATVETIISGIKEDHVNDKSDGKQDANVTADRLQAGPTKAPGSECHLAEMALGLQADGSSVVGRAPAADRCCGYLCELDAFEVAATDRILQLLLKHGARHSGS